MRYELELEGVRREFKSLSDAIQHFAQAANSGAGSAGVWIDAKPGLRYWRTAGTAHYAFHYQGGAFQEWTGADADARIRELLGPLALRDLTRLMDDE